MFFSVCRTLFYGAALGLAILMTGCSDEEEIGPGNRSLLVHVSDEADGQSVAGVKVVVMDPVANLPVAGPQISGPDGILDLGCWCAEEARLLVFGGVEYRVHALPDYWSGKRGGLAPAPLKMRDRWPLAPAAKSDPVRVIEVMVRKVSLDSLPRIAGNVVDTESGLPLDQVFVGKSPYLTGYQGATGPSDDVTAGDGAFSVSQIAFAVDPFTGNLFQIEPLLLTRQGYRPVIWKYDPPNGSDNVDISGVIIPMEPVTATDTGVIRGKIQRDGAPVQGVVVGLGAVATSVPDKAGPAMTGWTGVTDTEGIYTIANLPAGSYLLHPGYPLGDGAFFPSQPGNIPLQVNQGQEVQAPDLVVLHEIFPLSPANGLFMTEAPDSLFWTEVPAATTYEVRFDRGVLPLTDTHAVEIPESLVISPGLHTWSVRAFNDQAEILGATEIQSLFRFSPP